MDNAFYQELTSRIADAIGAIGDASAGNSNDQTALGNRNASELLDSINSYNYTNGNVKIVIGQNGDTLFIGTGGNGSQVNTSKKIENGTY